MSEIEPEEYGLDRFKVLLSPVDHAEIYAGRKELIAKLKKRINRAYATGSAMHTLLYGSFGAGKTHTLYNLASYIRDKGIEADIFHVTCPPIETSAVELYQKIILELGQATLYELVREVWNSVYPKFEEAAATTDESKIDVINDFVNHRDFATVVLAYQKPGTEMAYLVWKWLSGEKCSSTEKRKLGVITDNSNPTNAIDTLLTIIHMDVQLKKLKNQKRLFILMIDELDHLRPLGTAEDFIEFFRRLAEQEPLFAMLLAYTAATAEGIPALNAPPVRQRLGYPDNYIEISTFTAEESKAFIADLFRLLRPHGIDLNEKVEKAKSLTSETVSKDFFPFTEEAVDAVINQISGRGQPLCPRTIEMSLTRNIGDALIQDPSARIITADITS